MVERHGTEALKSVSIRSSSKNRRRKLLAVLVWCLGFAVLVGASAAWLGAKASTISRELSAAVELVTPLKHSLASENQESALETADRLRSHTAAARDAASDPLWTLASAVPGIGANFSAVAEVARSADDVANLGLAPIVKVYSNLDWDSVIPSSTGTNLEPLKSAAPSVTSAAHAVRASAERLGNIETSTLLPQVAGPLEETTKQLADVTAALDAAADAARLLPEMMGASEQRNYLLMIQNNAEARASGGIPGALAILTFENGRLSLGEQSSATEVGVMSPVFPVDPEQQQIYSGRLGKFMQDVNLTPDFPTAGAMAQAMWERKFGQRVDGVISVDPVVLSYILDATGPVVIKDPEVVEVAGGSLPLELSGENVVQTLLSEVYAQIAQPQLQDVYFAGVAQEVFGALSNESSDSKGLVEGITRGTLEGRVLVWSAQAQEQSVIAQYTMSGSVGGSSVSPAQFGAYFNDGTGAKMDYYVKRTVQLVKECPRDGYEETTVRITSTNTAPADAANSLPPYVTGNGVFGVPPGSVQTNIVAYGPAQAHVEMAKLGGQKIEFAPYFHSNRPVGILAIRLAPGESKTVDFTFGKIVQHTEPNVVVTPTVQDVKDVMLPTETAHCS